MTLALTISCDNAAFADDLPGEIARCLAHVAARIEAHHAVPGTRISIQDSNGNTVGRWEFRH